MSRGTDFAVLCHRRRRHALSATRRGRPTGVSTEHERAEADPERAVEAMLGCGADATISGKPQESQREQLQTLGFEGEWFDCHDVQGYMENLGIVLDGTLSAAVPPGTAQLLSDAAEPETSHLDLEQFLASKSANEKFFYQH